MNYKNKNNKNGKELLNSPVSLTGIRTKQELEDSLSLLSISENIILVFGAEWCGPCKKIKKLIYNETDTKHSLCSGYHDLQFVFIDINKNEELVSEYTFKTIPYFEFLKFTSGSLNRVGTLNGSDINELKLTIDKIYEF